MISAFKPILRSRTSQKLALCYKGTAPAPKQKILYSPLFFDDKVQEILFKISNIDLEKSFERKPRGVPLHRPKYKLLSTEQLQEEQENFKNKAKKYFQIPPLVNITDDNLQILDNDTSLDGHDRHHSKLVFVDLSLNISNNDRVVVVREPNGVLRTATKNEKFRMNQVYFPLEGRELEPPELFNSDNLKTVIKNKEYEFILDAACLQFEPTDKMYHDIINQVYEAINDESDFSKLASTRHFGSLAFYLVTHKKINNLLIEFIHTERLDDAVSLIKLYHMIHPNCQSAKEAAKNEECDLIKTFIVLNEKKKDEKLHLIYNLYISKTEAAQTSKKKKRKNPAVARNG